MLKRGIEAIQKGYFSMPFYIKRCQSAGLTLENIRTEEDYLKIPFTVKDDLRNTSPFERTTTTQKDIFGLYSSNGTTGKKTFYVYNYEDRKKHARFVHTYFSAIGMTEGGLGAVMAPIGSQVMGHCMMWQFQIMKMGMTVCSDPTPENILELVNNLPVTDIATLPRVASFLSEKEEWREYAKNSEVKRLILGGDFLSCARRKSIEETWAAKVYDSYGMSEAFGPLACECLMQKGLHYIDEDILVEIIDPLTGCPVQDGEIGIAVYTTLWAKGFPLLRYWSGDLFRKMTEPCACGCGLPRIEYIGRGCDCVFIDGRYISPKQMEEITLPSGIRNARVVLYADSMTLEYDEKEACPSQETVQRLKELFQYREIRCVSKPYEELALHTLKPKYLIDRRFQPQIFG